MQSNWNGGSEKLSASEKRKRRAAVTRYIREFKSGKKCAICNESFEHFLLEFDHIRGVKRFNISQARNLPLPVVIKEIEKCQLICGDCHKTKNWVEEHTTLGRYHKRMRRAA